MACQKRLTHENTNPGRTGYLFRLLGELRDLLRVGGVDFGEFILKLGDLRQQPDLLLRRLCLKRLNLLVVLCLQGFGEPLRIIGRGNMMESCW